MNGVTKVLAAGPGLVLAATFESIPVDGQPTLVTRAVWAENFSSERVLLHYLSLSWSGDNGTPTCEEWPYLSLAPNKRHTALNSELYFEYALRARALHGESFGLLLRRAVGLVLTVKAVTAAGPAFLTCHLWVPKQDRPDYFTVGDRRG